METNATFARFVKDPCISRKQKAATMEVATKSADETTRKLAGPLPPTLTYTDIKHVCSCIDGRGLRVTGEKTVLVFMQIDTQM